MRAGSITSQRVRSDDEKGACDRTVYVVGPVPSFRCGQPKEHPIHNVPNRGTHPYTEDR
jgi:hypothetical protein